MAYTMTAMHEHDLFVKQMEGYFPGAKVWTEVRGWEDPRPMYVIAFRNGMTFQGDCKHKTILDAKIYFEATLKLTGEAP
jgi:hypothetical protein